LEGLGDYKQQGDLELLFETSNGRGAWNGLETSNSWGTWNDLETSNGWGTLNGCLRLGTVGSLQTAEELGMAV
jgi:hypothetical protein